MELKYKDKDHPPVPQLKVGDICYCRWPWGRSYSHVSTCEIRKVEVKWVGDGWVIDYFIRTDIDSVGLKSTKRYAYHLGDDGRKPDIFLTPQEVMERNLEYFKKELLTNVQEISKKMKKLGMSDNQIKMLEQLK